MSWNVVRQWSTEILRNTYTDIELRYFSLQKIEWILVQASYLKASLKSTSAGTSWNRNEQRSWKSALIKSQRYHETSEIRNKNYPEDTNGMQGSHEYKIR
jgi:hypothetical protein